MEDKHKTQQCPEFPHFGAAYPDARCIDGYLYDLDKCDENGNLYDNDHDSPCPFCNSKEFIKSHLGVCGNTRKSLNEYINKMKEKYNYEASS